MVEGYTDVMAMHVAGVTTAVASCGTAFGDEHIGVLRRYLWDSEVIRGEVIYTFDGDAAGQKAALKAFDSDQKFAANTFIAVAPDDLDPCELRQQQGDGALRELIDSKRPLFAFAISAALAEYNLGTAEGRVAAARAVVPLVGRIREPDLRRQYVNEVAPQLGMEPPTCGNGSGRRRHVPAAAEPPAATPPPPSVGPPPAIPPRSAESSRPGHRGRAGGAEAGAAARRPGRRRVRAARGAPRSPTRAMGGCTPGSWRLAPVDRDAGAAWIGQVRDQLPPDLYSLLSELAVEPFRSRSEVNAEYAGQILAALLTRVAEARLRELTRVAPGRSRRRHRAADKLADSIAQWERYRRQLHERAGLMALFAPPPTPAGRTERRPRPRRVAVRQREPGRRRMAGGEQVRTVARAGRRPAAPVGLADDLESGVAAARAAGHDVARWWEAGRRRGDRRPGPAGVRACPGQSAHRPGAPARPGRDRRRRAREITAGTGGGWCCAGCPAGTD